MTDVTEATIKTTVHELLPDLRIVPIGSLMPHEEHDSQRAQPLIQRIDESGIWLNPPIVAPMNNGQFVILDGANRHYSLSELGFPYILVQVVDYESEDVQLETWNHVVSGLSWFEFLRNIREIRGLKVEAMDLLDARAALARREVLAYTILQDTQAYILRSSARTLADRTAVLRQIVDTYKQSGVLNRISTDDFCEARELYPQVVAIIVFPHYEPVEIMVAAQHGVYLPPGITRHLIRGRAMRLHYPLDALRENGESLEVKNQRLQAWIQERMAERRIRYYAESTFLFDE